MAISKETLISLYSDKPTLMEWLKKVESALKDASASSFEVNKKGNSTVSFTLTFANGDTLESGDIVLNQGEGVESGEIRDGHLILTLTNGENIDSGNLFNGDLEIAGSVNIGGDFTAEGDFTGGSVTAQTLYIPVSGSIAPASSGQTEIRTRAPIIESMADYAFRKTVQTGVDINYSYAGIVKNGNKLTYAIAGVLTFTDEAPANINVGTFVVPLAVAEKIYNAEIGAFSLLTYSYIQLINQTNAVSQSIHYSFREGSGIANMVSRSGLSAANSYYFRIEHTILISDNLI